MASTHTHPFDSLTSTPAASWAAAVNLDAGASTMAPPKRTYTSSTINTSPALSAFDPIQTPGTNRGDLSSLSDIDAYERANTFEGTQTPLEKLTPAQSKKIECWGHRGASAEFPENTMASFAATCAAGADGIETDVHITTDGRLVLFHDPEIDRTTDGKGKIHEMPWTGVLEHVRTLEEPRQPIPLFCQMVDLLMAPANMHVKLNIDCKVENNPDLLFPLIRKEMVRYPGWESLLAPRIILGIWHPMFIEPAKKHLPDVTLYCISMSPQEVREFFWDHVSGFSVWFNVLASAEGKKFKKDAAAAGKKITVWTVNDQEEMKECLRWGVQAIITDIPKIAVGIRDQVEKDPTGLVTTALQRWVKLWNRDYWPYRTGRESRTERIYLEREGGPFLQPKSPVQ